MGLDPGTLLFFIVLGSAAVVELVKSLPVWLKVSRPKVKIRLKLGDSEAEIDAENLPEQQAVIDAVLALVKTYGAE